MAYLLYDLLLLGAAMVLVPYYIFRGWRYGKVRRGIRERLGFYLPDRLKILAGRPVIWVHAVSVGETRAAIPLVKTLTNVFPDHALVVSNVTETGHEVARGIREASLCLFFPFDLSWVVQRALRQIQPSLIVIVETEIWPNFIRVAHRKGIPVVLVNGRISDRSFPRYRRLRTLVRPVLDHISAFCMQTAQDAERIRLIGAPAEKIEVTRNLKFDMQAPVADSGNHERLKTALALPPDCAVWAAGSTHAGEEEVVVDVYRRLLAEGRQIVLVLVPRHPERVRAVAGMLVERGLSVTLRTRVGERSDALRPGDVLLVDTLGEMLKIYATADLVFLGGSLVPVGGHNILEASLVHKPVIFGPYMQNFREIARLLLEAGGGMQIEDGAGLQNAVARLLANAELRRHMGEGGFTLLQQNVGATLHTVEVLRRQLKATV